MDFAPKKKKHSILTTLPLPISHEQKARYRKVQADLEKKGLDSLHDKTREQIDLILDAAEKRLSAG